MPFLFTPEIRAEQNAFFAAMNTPKGFISAFTPLFSPYKQYVIKGGPGTGKSTLMKRIDAEAKKRGLGAERYYCSSDTRSLDAIVIPALSLAVIDGTAPHTVEPTLVGVKDHYLDLSRFLDSRALEGCAAVSALATKKAAAYREAYDSLAALDAVDRLLVPQRENAFDREKCQKTLSRLLDRLSLTPEPNPVVRLTPISALGSEGYVAMTGYADKAALTVYISDRYGIAPAVFEELTALLSKRRVSYHHSLSPITVKTDTVYLPKREILITSLPQSSEPALRINCERFLYQRGQGIYKGQKPYLAAEEALFDGAKKALVKAANAHREAERYYIAAMDFDALNNYTETLIDRLFSW